MSGCREQGSVTDAREVLIAGGGAEKARAFMLKTSMIEAMRAIED